MLEYKGVQVEFSIESHWLNFVLVFRRANMASVTRQNFHEECEAGINKQINLELFASYTYLSMAFYFDRDDQKMPNFSKFLKKQSADEREHAMKLMEYQNKRGGQIVLKDIKKPESDEWGSAAAVLETALELEK